MYDDFVDLRSHDLSGDSFWPSFTDIMMVVVMIFLLTSTILMVRNWELINQLRGSLIAEQQASELIRSTSQENATLEEQLVNAQNEISILRVQAMQSSEQTSALSSELEIKERRIIIISSENQTLDNNLRESERQITDLSTKIQQLNTDLHSVRKNITTQAQELKESRGKIILLNREKDSQSTVLAALDTNFKDLKVKYDKLIKPARTAKGKHVVEVQYQRVDNIERIRFKDVGDTAYRTLTQDELSSVLVKAKQDHPKSLYIKMIIPEDSGLSYSEAWTFMRVLLEKYDYYYQ